MRRVPAEHKSHVAAVPDLLDALRRPASASAVVAARATLAPVFVLPPLGTDGGATWEEHRSLVVTAWFAVCH